MEDEKALALFAEILEKTRGGRIKWEPTAEEDQFVASIGGKFTVLALRYTSQSLLGPITMADPTLILKDADGREVIRVSSIVNGLTVGQLSELYGMVRRQALRVDEKVDEVLAELGKL